MFIDLKSLEEHIVTALKPLASTRKLITYANPSDYDLTNIPANGLGFIYVAIANISTPQVATRKFGPIITQPIININIKLVQRGGHSHKLCYPSIEQIINLSHGSQYLNGLLTFSDVAYDSQDKDDKCWQYSLGFKYCFDLVADCCSGC